MEQIQYSFDFSGFRNTEFKTKMKNQTKITHHSPLPLNWSELMHQTGRGKIALETKAAGLIRQPHPAVLYMGQEEEIRS